MYRETYGSPFAPAFTGETYSRKGFLVSAAQPEYIAIKDIPDLSQSQNYPLRHFGLPLSNHQFQSFKSLLLSEFRTLSWDLYDVRLKCKQAIESNKPILTNAETELLLDFYRGEVPSSAIEDLFQALPQHEQERLNSLRPYRKKACSKLIARTAPAGHWHVAPLHSDAVLQRVALTDYRSIARKYKALPKNILQADGFKSLISCVIEMVKEQRPETSCLEITAWMMTCYTWVDGPTTNSPEGIHQDGADYVVTAFVIERENVTGGVSRVFVDDMTSPREEILVQPAQGLFHADAGSSLWHDVTHIEVSPDSGREGIRSVLGLDINVRQ